MLFGLLFGNLIELDYIYYRIIGKIDWFESACPNFGMQCSFEFYPLHNIYGGIFVLFLSLLIFVENWKLRFVGWFCFNVFLNLVLDILHLLIGFGI